VYTFCSRFDDYLLFMDMFVCYPFEVLGHTEVKIVDVIAKVIVIKGLMGLNLFNPPVQPANQLCQTARQVYQILSKRIPGWKCNQRWPECKNSTNMPKIESKVAASVQKKKRRKVNNTGIRTEKSANVKFMKFILINSLRRMCCFFYE
jgi:hypothetical protein